MPAWKSKRVQKQKEKQKKNKRWERDSKSKSKSKSRKRDSVKKHYTRKLSRRTKTDRDEFSKFLKDKAKKRTKEVWKPKTKRKPVTPKSKNPKKTKKRRWAHDWNFDAMMDVSDDSLEKHRQQLKKTAKPATALGLPNWPPKAPSASQLPMPEFSVKPHKSESPSPVNFSDDDMKIIKTVLEDAFKPSPKPIKLIEPNYSKKTKRNELLTPSMIQNFGKGVKNKKSQKKKRKRKHGKTNKKKK